MKSKFLIAISLIVVLILSCASCGNKQEVEIVENMSFHIDFQVVEDKVEIQYNIRLRNNTNESKTVNLAAFLPEDEGRLLKEAKIYAMEQGELAEFVVPANSERQFDEVTFVGDYGGVNRKANRLLPQIEITIVE